MVSISLAKPQATIWLVDARCVNDVQLAAGLSWLGASETSRHARFVRPARQRQFLIGRTLLRLALGSLLSLPPSAIVLDERPGQAPLLRLDGATIAPSFSLSHSGHWIACALSCDGALGLDIEVRDPGRDVVALARQAFGTAAAYALQALAPGPRLLAFYAQWSEHEALYKLGASRAPTCLTLAHAQLSIVLCSAEPLDVALRAASLEVDSWRHADVALMQRTSCL